MPFWLLGSLGIVAIEASYVPQILRIAKLRRAEQVSLLFPGLNFTGRILAMSYAMMSGDAVFGVGFMFGALLRGTLFVQVLYYRHLAAKEGGARVEPLVGEAAAS